MTTDQILADILRREGGYVDHPSDKGGCTNYGITVPVLAEWRKRPVDCRDIFNLQESEARDIYRARYIAPFDAIDVAAGEPDFRPLLIDIAVNSGPRRAQSLLAEALKEAAHTKRPIKTELVIARLHFYARIVRDNRKQGDFIVGWVNRAVEFL